MTEQIIELFPSEDGEIYYTPYRRTNEGQAVGAKGCLYNHYKNIRKNLRAAGLLVENVVDENQKKILRQSTGIKKLVDERAGLY